MCVAIRLAATALPLLMFFCRADLIRLTLSSSLPDDALARRHLAKLSSA